MNKEIKGDIVYYTLTSQEVEFLKFRKYGNLVIWHIPAERRGGVKGDRIIGTDKDTEVGKRNQELLEGLIKEFSEQRD